MNNLSELSWNQNKAIAWNGVLDVEFSDDNPIEPVLLDEAKNWCRVDITDDDDLITSLISSARSICENHCNTSFITRTVTARLNNGLGNMLLPYGPVVGNLATITDDDGTDIDPDNFNLRGVSFKRLDLINNVIVNVSYEAGYEILPANLKTALLNQIAWMYENRGDAAVAGKLSEQAKLILNQVRRV